MTRERKVSWLFRTKSNAKSLFPGNDRLDRPPPHSRRPPSRSDAGARPARRLGPRGRGDPLACAPPAPAPALEPPPRLSRAPPLLAPAAGPRELPAADRDRAPLARIALPFRAPDPLHRPAGAVRGRLRPRVRRTARGRSSWRPSTSPSGRARPGSSSCAPDVRRSSASSSARSTTPSAGRVRAAGPASGTGCGSCRAGRGSPRRWHPARQGLRRRPLRPERGQPGRPHAPLRPGVLVDRAARGSWRRSSGPSCARSTRGARRSGASPSSPNPVPFDGTAAGATLSLNRWFEAAMSDEGLCASWLWAHDRWRNQDVPSRRLRLEAKRNLLEADLRDRGLRQLPRNTRFWIRMPNWLGDVVMALPLVRALRASRPDAEITLLARPAFVPLLEALWRGRPGPLAARAGARATSRTSPALRACYPDTWILLTNSAARRPRGAGRGAAPSASGSSGPAGAARSSPTRTALPAGFDESRHHQVELWENFLRHFGLDARPDFSPFPAHAPGPADRPPAPRPAPIGLIAGSENDPSKRWPAAGWRSLIEALPGRALRALRHRGRPGDHLRHRRRASTPPA